MSAEEADGRVSIVVCGSRVGYPMKDGCDLHGFDDRSIVGDGMKDDGDGRMGGSGRNADKVA